MSLKNTLEIFYFCSLAPENVLIVNMYKQSQKRCLDVKWIDHLNISCLGVLQIN